MERLAASTNQKSRARRFSLHSCWSWQAALVSLALVVQLPGEVLAWGRQGHQAVGELAETILQQSNPSAYKAVQGVLGDGVTLASVSTWPDELKEALGGKGPLAHDPEARAFNKKFPHNRDWHFVNLPLGMATYTDTGAFSTPTDIVHIINQCVKVLETSKSQKTQFTKVQALRLLVHLAGDIHQPLHVGTGYYQFDGQDHPGLVRDPQQALGLLDDRGGNDLQFGPNQEDEVHFFWDVTIVEQIAGSQDPHELALKLATKVPSTGWDTPGDYHTWAERWASDAVVEANRAYDSLTFGTTTFSGAHSSIKQIETTLPATYSQDQKDRATMQLAKAGYHLAGLLAKIRWK